MSSTQQPDAPVGLPSFVELLKKFPGSPDQSQIDAWKAEHGEIFVSAFSEVELFIFRPLKRMEWRENQLKLAQQQGADPMQVEEGVVRQCLLWMSPVGDQSLTTKAGSCTTLHEQIMQNSNFVDPRLVSNLVVKL